MPFSPAKLTSNKDISILMTALDDQLFFVGGCLRDSILNLSLKDIDLATPYPPDIIIKKLSEHKIKYLTIGYEYGTITAIINGQLIEITSFRKDIETDGRYTKVIYNATMNEDVLRRDFTINSLYMDKAGNLYDLLGCGIQDIRQGNIRFIGDETQRITEDYLRILRFFRFYGLFGKTKIPQRTLQTIKNLSHHLSLISKERIRNEFLAILSSPQNIKTLLLMHKSDTLMHLNFLCTKDDILTLQKLLKFEEHLNLPPDYIRYLFMLNSQTVPNLLDFRISLTKEEKQQFSSLNNIATIFNLIQQDKLKEALYRFSRATCINTFIIKGGLKGNYRISQKNRKILDNLLHLPIPVFHISQSQIDLIRANKEKKLSFELSKIKQKWIESNFSLNLKALLEET